MMITDGKIYLITNNISNKSYIGRTTQSICRRFRAHFNNSTNRARRAYKTHISRAIRRYGFENFSILVLEDNIIDNNVLNKREIFWIKEKQTFGPNGYNMTNGGEGGDTSFSENYKRSVSKRDVSGKNNPMYGKRGSENPNFGKKRTDRQKTNLSIGTKAGWDQNFQRKEILSKKVSGENNPMFGKLPPNSVKITVDGFVYNSIAAARRALGISYNAIRKRGTLVYE